MGATMKNSKAPIWRALLVGVRCLVIPPAVLQLINLSSSAHSAEWTFNEYALCLSIQIGFASLCICPYPIRLCCGKSKWVFLAIIMVLTGSMLRYHLIAFEYISSQAQTQPDLIADFERAKDGPPGFSSFGLNGEKVVWLVKNPKWSYSETPIMLAFSCAPLLLFAIKLKILNSELPDC